MTSDLAIGAVRLAVGDLDRVREFYERAIGLRTLSDGEIARLGVDAAPLVELAGEPGAPPRPPRTTGLFHLAILVPSRLELARALRRLTDAGWRLSGAADHLVSEALYLDDPEGNGIEIYRDRPREQWSHAGGQLQMATLPLDLDSLLDELGEAGDAGATATMPPGTRIGHVHLNVADLAAAEHFYAGALGLEVTVRGYPGALFLATGGYHHHIGVNTWAGEGAPPPPPDSRGLRHFTLTVPADALDPIAERLTAAGYEAQRDTDSLHTTDPSGIRLLLVPS